MRKILLMIPLLMLGGCLSLEGITATASSTTAAVVGTVLGGPGVGAAVGAAAGLTTDAFVNPGTDPVDFAGKDGELNFSEFLAFAWYNFTSHLITIGIMLGLLWIITGYLGIRAKRPEEKVLEKTLLTKIMKE